MQSIEIEVKFRVRDLKALEATLSRLGFHCETPRTFERNILFDTPAHELRNSRQILRVRRYGDRWLLTHKKTTPNDSPEARHKERIETETNVEDGEALGAIFSALGYTSTFVYEKWRSEWADSEGHCVLDETPIGTYAELEGPPAWIDESLAALNIDPATCLTDSYGKLFLDWKQRTGNPADHLTFADTTSPALTR